MDNNEYFGHNELSENTVSVEVNEQIIQTNTLEILSVANVDNVCGDNYLIISATDRKNRKLYSFIDYNIYDNYIRYSKAKYGTFKLLVQTIITDGSAKERNFIQVVEFDEVKIDDDGAAKPSFDTSSHNAYLNYCKNELNINKDGLQMTKEELEFSQNLTLNEFNEKLYKINKKIEIKELDTNLAAINYMDNEFIRFNLNRPRKFNINYGTAAIHLSVDTLVLIMQIFSQYLKTPLTYRENDEPIKNLKNKTEKYKLESVNINKNQLNRFFVYGTKDKAISLEDFDYANNSSNFKAQFTDAEISKYISSNGISSKQYKKIKIN